jgi:hypothetical protein
VSKGGRTLDVQSPFALTHVSGYHDGSWLPPVFPQRRPFVHISTTAHFARNSFWGMTPP